IRRAERRLHARAARSAVCAYLGGRKTAPGVRDHRDAARAGALLHGAERGAARPAEARAAKPRARPGDPAKRKGRVRGRRAAVQPRLAEADPGDPVRAAEVAGEEEDAVGAALHRRGLARRARARPSAAAPDPRAPHAVEAEVD